MTPLVATLLAALAVGVVHLVALATSRLAPAWTRPALAPRWLLAAGLLAIGSGVADAFGATWLAYLSPRLGVAEAGPGGAFAALALSLAALLAIAAVLHLVARDRVRSSRAPAGPLALLFGVAPDGSALDAVQRPLRWAAHGLSLALIAALAFMPVDPIAWALAVTASVALARAFARSPSRAAAAVSAAASETRDVAHADAHAAFHRALGSPPLFEREPEVAAAGDFVRAIVDARGRLVAVAAPEGAGKLRAARLLAERAAARGRETLWLSDEKLGPQTNSLADLVAAIARGANHQRLGLVVVDARIALSAESLATLRYGLHRLCARAGIAPDVLVLGSSPAVVTIARAIGAAEPTVVQPATPLPTRTIQRYLLSGVPDARLTQSPPAHVAFVALDRPAPLARHPAAPAREYLIAAGGPRGRRMREDRAAGLTRGRASRLLVALPGDRDTPERQDGLARSHLRAALGEAPQDPRRLREVFSPALVDHELASLERAGLLTRIAAWEASPHGLVAVGRVRARLGPANGDDAAASIALVEPRSGRKKEVARGRVELELYDGAITTLEAGPIAARFEVRRAGSERVLVPTELVSAAPLRTLTTTLASTPRKTRLRFRGAREIEVWEGAVDVVARHRGVKQFAAAEHGGAEARAYTRLLPEPIDLPPLRTAARMLVFDPTSAPAAPSAPSATPGAPSSSALHAMTHALREVLPCFFDNAADLAVTFGDVAGRPAIILFDAHPDGLGTSADLRDDDLEALVAAACELLECTCAAHCAECCESTSCSLDASGHGALDRREALRVLSELVTPRPIAMGAMGPIGPLSTSSPAGARAQAALLRRTA